MLSSCLPVLAVADVREAVQFYTDVLGFTSSWMSGEPPTVAGASWGKAGILFMLDPDLAGRMEGHQVWMDAKDLDGLYALHIERGAEIVSPIEDKPWGYREYTVRDPNGYRLRFTSRPTEASSGPGVFPSDVMIVRRMPNQDEFARVSQAAFSRHIVPQGVLDRSWAGVVAVDSGGEVIGMVRIVFDGPGWYSVWDVAVVPAWQGHRIGTAMVEEALDLIRESSPGANVYLFTFKDGFYERLGFTKETVHMLKV